MREGSDRMILNEIQFSKVPKFEIAKPQEEREKRATALNDIVVFDSPPFGKSLVEEALLGGLYEADDNELHYPQKDNSCT